MEVQRFNWQQLDHNNSSKIEAQELQDLAAEFDVDGDGQLNAAEGQAANIHSARDLAAVNQAISQAAGMQPSEVLFGVPKPNPVAPTLRKLERAMDNFGEQWQQNMAALQDGSYKAFSSDEVSPEMRQKISQRLMQAMTELDAFKQALKKYPDTTDLQKFVFLQDQEVDPADLEALLEHKLQETQDLFRQTLTNPSYVASQVPDPVAPPRPRPKAAPQPPELPEQAKDLLEVMDQLSQAQEHIENVQDPARRARYEQELAQLEDTLLPKEAQAELKKLVAQFEKSLPNTPEYRQLREELREFQHQDSNDAITGLKWALKATKVIAKLAKVRIPGVSGQALDAIQQKLGEIVNQRARQKLEAYAAGVLF
ncbi:MAG: hypothetical protein CVV27_00730 [Candidatus Melainabacteria bacterium HGW-Melainabacteria-1]|nr:MAG: hypothetical protein CVV27_00730 [Candidatus Melainabacteria bacterium HGW-Melainabacteria-1]